MARINGQMYFKEEIQAFVLKEVRDLEKRIIGILNTKKDQAVSAVEIGALKDVTQQIAMKANLAMEESMKAVKLPHACSQMKSIESITDDIMSIKKVLYGGRGLKATAVIALIVALLTGSAFIFDVRTKTEVTQIQVLDMKQDVVALQAGSQRLEKTMKKNNNDGDKQYRNILDNLQSINDGIRKIDESSFNNGKRKPKTK